MNKLLQTIEENDEGFDKEFKIIGNYFSKDGFPNHPIHIPLVNEIKSHITQSRIKELEALDRKSTRLNSSHTDISRMPSSA